VTAAGVEEIVLSLSSKSIPTREKSADFGRRREPDAGEPDSGTASPPAPGRARYVGGHGPWIFEETLA
jgi:hypothetical protein